MKFDGETFAQKIKQQLKPKVADLIKAGTRPNIVSFVFKEDKTGQLYTRLKRETADELEIIYKPKLISFTNSIESIRKEIQKLNKDIQVTGIMIQKPTKKDGQK